MLAALRPKQWIKNLIVLLPLIFARRMLDPQAAVEALGAVGAFCLLSSAIYLVNDVLDRGRDRLHPKKCQRPIASGRVSPTTALVVAALLATAGLVGSLLLNRALAGAGAIYVLAMLAYSVWLRHISVLDVSIIAGGFVLRVVAGALAIGVLISPWLYVCTGAASLLLALGKRRAELDSLGGGAESHRPALQGYTVPLLDQYILISAAVAIVAYSLYSFSSPSVPRGDLMMLTIPFVVYGIFRYLYLVQRRGEGGAPDELLWRDRPLAVTAVLWALASAAVFF